METFTTELVSATPISTTIAISGHVDTTNASDFEKSVMELRAQNSGGALVLDAAGLEYISSAGLRVIMRLVKRNRGMSLINASPEVYEIFEVTGFVNLLSVKRAPREMSIEGLEEIGRGATATVYRIDPETAVKVFGPNVGLEQVQKESTRCRDAFMAGIPTAIPFDTVKVGDCYGSVFELLEAESFTSVLAKNKAQLAENVARFANEIRKLHQIEVEPEKFNNSRATSLMLLGRLVGNLCTEEEAAKIRKVYENIPERHTFLHGDCHPGNVMVQNGEFVFIDLAAGGMGHPIFDMMSMRISYGVISERGRSMPHVRPFTDDECHLIWHTFISTYLGSEDEEFIKKAERQIQILSSARIIFANIGMPGFFPREAMRRHVDYVCKEVDAGLEPLCF